MSIEINGIELAHVHQITTFEGGGYLQQQVPGLAGDVTQDLGRQSLQLQVDGTFYGPDREKDLEALRDIYLKREPVEFLAQVTGQAYASKVLIDSLKVMEAGQQPDQFTYQLVVIEYVEPPSASVDTGLVNDLIAAEALQITDLMELPDMLSLGSIPELSNPIEPLKGALTPIQEASSVFLEASQGLKQLFGSK